MLLFLFLPVSLFYRSFSHNFICNFFHFPGLLNHLLSVILYKCVFSALEQYLCTHFHVSKAKMKITVVNAVRSATENTYSENERTLLYKADMWKSFPYTYQLRLQRRLIHNKSSDVTGRDKEALTRRAKDTRLLQGYLRLLQKQNSPWLSFQLGRVFYDTIKNAVIN